MTEPHITLFSADLLSKWGFNDGDTPEAWLDWCETQGIDSTAIGFPLVALVRQHLEPVIEQDIVVTEIGTAHNPIRALQVDGVYMGDVWYGRPPAPYLSPEYVTVPMVEVLRLALVGAGLSEAPGQGPSLT
ncbi:hypothetical protein ACFVTT_34105 [Streptomyces niveus]|uniref:hypothetical protein n=1 Tax=Streptomyces niveus TaxID=193462 RepID=UPI00341E9F69